MRTRAVVLVAIAALGGGSLFYVHHRDALQPLPVFAPVPTAVPAADVRHEGRATTCHVPSGLPEPPGDVVSGHLWVDPDPDGGVALWRPGLNASPCRARLTQITTAQATAFAAAIEHAQPVPAGTYSCPADDGAAVDVYLTYAGQTRAEVVRVPLGGCGWVTAPGRDEREAWGALAALGPIPEGLTTDGGYASSSASTAAAWRCSARRWGATAGCRNFAASAPSPPATRASAHSARVSAV